MKNKYPSTVELAEMLRDGHKALIACATVRGHRPPPGYVRDYVCVVCEVELLLSPRAVEQVAIGGVPVCAECGIKLAEARVAAGNDTSVCLSPETEAALARGTTKIDPARVARLLKKTEGP